MLHTLITRHSKTILPFFSALLIALFLSIPAMADTLSDLRASGAIGENVSGYVVVRDASAQAAADGINAKRHGVYTEKAAAQGVSVEQVGRVYAAEILKKIPAGTWIQNDSGQWSQK
jgi:uncharacterized protein YdbL (DUF1318 family)